MKNVQLTVFFLLITFCAIAQASDLNPYNNFKVGKTYYLLADSVNVRKAADPKAELLTKALIGTAVTILEKSKADLLLYGYRAPWYKISFNGKTGYVWGGFIALQRVAEGDLQFLFGLDKILNTKDEGNPAKNIMMQLRVCLKNKQLQRLNIEGLGILYGMSELEIKNKIGISGLKNAVHLKTNDGDGNAKLYVFFWNGKTLQNVKTLDCWAGATGSVKRFFIYPTDEKGKPEKIIQRIVTQLTTEEHEEDEAIYIWKNGKLEKISK